MEKPSSSSHSSTGLEGFLDGSQVCPARFIPNLTREASSNRVQAQIRVNLEYVTWIRIGQAIIVWLLRLIIETMLSHVVICTSSQQVWSTLTSLFSSNLKARLLQLRFQLQMLKKGSMTIHDYFLKIRGIADTLAFTGQSISDDELLLYVLGGLGSKYDPVVVNLTLRQDSVSL